MPTPQSWIQLAVYLLLLLAAAWPLGIWLAAVAEGRLPRGVAPVVWIERAFYRLAGVDPEESTGWKRYAVALVAFNVIGVVAVYALQRLQGVLPLNPQAMAGVEAGSSFNTAVSFVTNTNWQGYGGESTMSYLTQMLALAVQNFFSAATGIAVVWAMVRGFVARSSGTVGNFWVDVTRSTLYVLLPLSLLFAVFLVSQGVIQNFDAYKDVTTLEVNTYSVAKKDAAGEPLKDAKGEPVMEEVKSPTQSLPMGPIASQEAIKMLGTNGGGPFNANSAHPYENPTPLSNFVQMLSIFLIPAALVFAFGRMVGDRRQGWALLAAMLAIFVPLLVGAIAVEQAGNPAVAELGVDQEASDSQSGGNMEGKEVRYGIANSALWATATTAASNGSVNAMHDSFTPLGGLVPMWLMQLGEVVFGGVGSGLYGMLMFAIVAVFIAGLMVGRTPEFLGKKIEAYEMKMSSLVILITPALVLIGTSVAVVTAAGKAGILNPGSHGFSEILYAFSSASNNNGSAFAGLSANTPFYNTALGLAMLFGRYWLAVPVLAIAGSLARKKTVPSGPGTLATHTPLFVALLIGVVVLVGALTFVPALALGPIVEHLTLIAVK